MSDVTFVFASFIGPVLFLTGVSVVLHPKRFEKLDKEFMHSPALLYLTGLVLFVLGLIVVQAHNVWDDLFTGIISFMGWAMLVKSILLMAFPKFAENLYEACTKGKTNNRGMYVAGGILMLLAGAYLSYPVYLA